MTRHDWIVWTTFVSYFCAEPLDVTRTLSHCLNIVFTLQGLRYNTASVIGQRLETTRLDWQRLSAAYQQLNFTLTQMQQENG
jgi:hypothetical protein